MYWVDQSIVILTQYKVNRLTIEVCPYEPHLTGEVRPYEPDMGLSRSRSRV